MESKPITILNYFMLIVFVYMVAVQYNDPDAPLWMATYGLAAIACILALRGKLNWGFSALLALATFGWALFLAPQVIGKVSFGELFESMEMKTIVVEQAREMGGLLITAVWMLILTITGRHRSTSVRQ